MPTPSKRWASSRRPIKPRRMRFDRQTKRYLQFEQLKGAERTPEAFDQYVTDLKQIRNDGAED